MAKVEQSHGFKRFSGFIIFILIAALLWLIIKLSDTYNVTVPFAIHYVDNPSSHILTNNDQEVSVSVQATGFKLLNYYLSVTSHRKVDISIKDIVYRGEGNSTYSYSSRYLEDKIADFLSISQTDVKYKEDNLTFTMELLNQKKVRVVANKKLTFYSKQYKEYGEPVIEPDSITIYGSNTDIAKISEVYTEAIVQKNVKNDISTNVKLDLDENISADVEEVSVLIKVEQFTENEVIVKITEPEDIKLEPNQVTVKYSVAMKDYSTISNMSFEATIDTTDLFVNDLLPVNVRFNSSSLDYEQVEPKILSIKPKEVKANYIYKK